MTTTSPIVGTPTAATAPDAMKQLSGNFDTFLTLLTTQLKNQDPTSPMDSNQFTQQLVQFSQVEQQIATNTNLKSILTQGATQSGAFATSYLGKTVSVTNGQASLTGGNAAWNYNLGTDASVTALTVTNASGKVVYVAPGETTSGNHAFAWNGKDGAGNQLADGTYTLNATAQAADGSNVVTAIRSSGQVNEIDMTSGVPQLVIGSMKIGLSDIAHVAN
jgi:flagellar basal-body rod modification protein FlgD